MALCWFTQFTMAQCTVAQSNSNEYLSDTVLQSSGRPAHVSMGSLYILHVHQLHKALYYDITTCVF